MKVKFCAQRDMMDCGAACLQSICQHYGKEIELLHIRNLCHITRNGVSMLGIADADKVVAEVVYRHLCHHFLGCGFCSRLRQIDFDVVG